MLKIYTKQENRKLLTESDNEELTIATKYLKPHIDFQWFFVLRGLVCPQHTHNRVFYKHTALAIMPILASEAFLRENKKFQYKNATPVNIELLDLWFQVRHSPFLTYLAFTCKGIPTLNVSGSGKCWSMVTLGNGSGTDFQASSLTSIGHWCWCCADSRCVYIA